jgi:hypothetical protein
MFVYLSAKERTILEAIRKEPSRSIASPVNPPPAQDRSGLWPAVFVLGAIALAVETPFFFKGMPSGHDVEFHLYSWLEILGQWKQGIMYPRWASLAHFGFGEPRFVFYPPASWMLGSALSALFPWTVVASIYIWIVLVAAGLSMFMLARKWLNRRDAIFAAALYAANPYHLVIVYWRSAFAELLASCLIPLLLLLVLKAMAEGWRTVLPLALLLAAAWLANAPAAVMIHYSLALLTLLLAWRLRSPRLLAIVSAAVVLGACLSAFYLIPAIYEQKWINIAQALSPGSRPQDNFLFIHTTDADHDAFNRIISWIAIAEIVITLTAAGAARALRETKRDVWTSLVAWAIACSVLMFSVSGVFWNHLPKLRFMQFPWRWLLCLSMLLSLFVTVGLQRWWTRLVVCLATLLVVVVAWHNIQAPWWDTAADLREMQDNMESGPGYEGTDEYTPLGADPSAINKDARRVTVEGPEHAAIHVFKWNAESKFFTAEMSAPAKLALRLFDYPAWQVEVNGQTVQADRREDTGQMLVPVQRGTNRVQITLIQTQDRTLGAVISLAAWLCLLLSPFLMGKHKSVST